MSLPLEGVRIVAIEQYGAGPFATMHLADMGAEVIKIEDPTTGGDSSRYIIPHTGEQDSLFYQSFNRNKKSVTLNLRTQGGKETLLDLVRVSDAIFCSLRGDQPWKLRLRYEDLRAYNPKIVCCFLSGYGLTGPRAAHPSYDYLIQGYTGMMSITGEPDGPPTKFGISVCDFAGGFSAAMALLMGLYAAQVKGEGGNIETSLHESSLSMLNYLAIWHLTKDYMPRKTADSAHPTIVPSQNFRTKDGYIVVMCVREKFWSALCEGLGAPELAEDERFKSFADRGKNKEVLLPILKHLFLQKTTAEHLAAMQKQVPCAPINDFAQAFQDEQVLARDMVIEVEHPSFGTLRETACPVRVDGASSPRSPGPGLGEHTETILSGLLHYSHEKIAGLRAAGAV